MTAGIPTIDEREKERDDEDARGVGRKGEEEKGKNAGHKILLVPSADEEGRWNFYNDTFCTRDYFRDVLAGIGKVGEGDGGGARARAHTSASAIPRATAGNEFACRPHVLPAFFFMLRRGSLMWKTCCENLRATEAYYFRLLIREAGSKARATNNTQPTEFACYAR